MLQEQEIFHKIPECQPPLKKSGGNGTGISTKQWPLGAKEELLFDQAAFSTSRNSNQSFPSPAGCNGKQRAQGILDRKNSEIKKMNRKREYRQIFRKHDVIQCF